METEGNGVTTPPLDLGENIDSSMVNAWWADNAWDEGNDEDDDAHGVVGKDYPMETGTDDDTTSGPPSEIVEPASHHQVEQPYASASTWDDWGMEWWAHSEHEVSHDHDATVADDDDERWEKFKTLRTLELGETDDGEWEGPVVTQPDPKDIAGVSGPAELEGLGLDGDFCAELEALCELELGGLHGDFHDELQAILDADSDGEQELKDPFFQPLTLLNQHCKYHKCPVFGSFFFRGHHADQVLLQDATGVNHSKLYMFGPQPTSSVFSVLTSPSANILLSMCHPRPSGIPRHGKDCLLMFQFDVDCEGVPPIAQLILTVLILDTFMLVYRMTKLSNAIEFEGGYFTCISCKCIYKHGVNIYGNRQYLMPAIDLNSQLMKKILHHLGGTKMYFDNFN